MTFPHHFCAGCGELILIGHRSSFSSDEIRIDLEPSPEGTLRLTPNILASNLHEDLGPIVTECSEDEILERLEADPDASFYARHECREAVSA